MADHTIDLDDLESSARRANGTFTVGDAIVPSLIARIRELERALAACHGVAGAIDIPDILGRGTVLLPSIAAWGPKLGDEVEDVKHTGRRGTVVRNQGGRLPWVVRHPNGTETGYAAHELRLIVGAP